MTIFDNDFDSSNFIALNLILFSKFSLQSVIKVSNKLFEDRSTRKP